MTSEISPITDISEQSKQGDAKAIAQDLQRLIRQLNQIEETVSEDVESYFLWNYGTDREQWIPAVYGATTAGVGTYAANKQIGWVMRKGLLVDCWFDITWTAHTGSGNLYVQLPYLVAEAGAATEQPFVGVLQPSSITLGTFTCAVCSAIPDTRRLEIWGSGSSLATGNVALPSSGRIMGSIRYIGQEREAE